MQELRLFFHYSLCLSWLCHLRMLLLPLSLFIVSKHTNKRSEFESQKVSVSICKCARNVTGAKDKKNLLHAISNEKWKQSSGPDVKRHLKMSRVYFNERFVFIPTVHVFARTFDPHRRRKQKLIIAFSSIILK